MERRLGAGKFGVAWLVTDLKLPEHDRDRMFVYKKGGWGKDGARGGDVTTIM